MMAQTLPDILLAVIGGYLLGSIPFGLLLTKLGGLGDIRAIGSGNIGATNVLRTGNKALAALTLLLDVGKGVAAVMIVGSIVYGVAGSIPADVWMGIAGLGAVLGHVFPIWLRFKGGKGVATALGVFLAIAWPMGLACIATWLVVAAVFRLSSLAALFAMALAPVYASIWVSSDEIWFPSLIAVLVIARHHGNIRRLIQGKEPRIGKTA